MDDDLSLPAFLDRKQNGIKTETPMIRARANHPKIVWPKKRNWRKLAERRRKREKAEGITLKTFKPPRGA